MIDAETSGPSHVGLGSSEKALASSSSMAVFDWVRGAKNSAEPILDVHVGADERHNKDNIGLYCVSCHALIDAWEALAGAHVRHRIIRREDAIDWLPSALSEEVVQGIQRWQEEHVKPRRALAHQLNAAMDDLWGTRERKLRALAELLEELKGVEARLAETAQSIAIASCNWSYQRREMEKRIGRWREGMRTLRACLKNKAQRESESPVKAGSRSSGVRGVGDIRTLEDHRRRTVSRELSRTEHLLMEFEQSWVADKDAKQRQWQYLVSMMGGYSEDLSATNAHNASNPEGETQQKESYGFSIGDLSDTRYYSASWQAASYASQAEAILLQRARSALLTSQHLKNGDGNDNDAVCSRMNDGGMASPVVPGPSPGIQSGGKVREPVHDSTPEQRYASQYHTQVEELPAGTKEPLLYRTTQVLAVDSTQLHREKNAEQELRRKERWEALCAKEKLIEQELEDVLSSVGISPTTTTSPPKELKGKDIPRYVSAIPSDRNSLSQLSLRPHEALRMHRERGQGSASSSRDSSIE